MTANRAAVVGGTAVIMASLQATFLSSSFSLVPKLRSAKFKRDRDVTTAPGWVPKRPAKALSAVTRMGVGMRNAGRHRAAQRASLIDGMIIVGPTPRSSRLAQSLPRSLSQTFGSRLTAAAVQSDCQSSNDSDEIILNRNLRHFRSVCS